MTDAHNHLQDLRFDGIREKVIHEMQQCGITRCIVNGTSPDDWQAVSDLASSYPNLIVPSFGLHPWKPPTSDWYSLLVHFLDSTPRACIGECGLDRWIKNYDLEQQKEIFIAQLDLATKRNLALSIHCLKAWGPLLDILRSHPLPKRGFLIHSYNGSAELVPELVQLGAYFSVSGYFLHQRKEHMIEVFQNIPTDRLLLETDAPDMLPPEEVITYQLSKKINHPANLKTIRKNLKPHLDLSNVDTNFSSLFLSK